jgi:hypothetical protein
LAAEKQLLRAVELLLLLLLTKSQQKPRALFGQYWQNMFW